jgi:hypothetical protein
LVQGLKKVIDLKVHCLRVFGVSEIIVRKVNNYIHCLSHFKSYQQEGWKLINYFDAFIITSIPHSHNVVVDTLANATSRVIPLNNGFTIKLAFRPYVPDNVMNWREFNDDSHLIYFLTNVDIF